MVIVSDDELDDAAGWFAVFAPVFIVAVVQLSLWLKRKP